MERVNSEFAAFHSKNMYTKPNSTFLPLIRLQQGMVSLLLLPSWQDSHPTLKYIHVQGQNQILEGCFHPDSVAITL